MGFLEDKRRARIFYRFLSTIYDRVNPYVWTKAMRAEALSILDLDDDSAVLDVGCGTGFGTLGLLDHVDHVVGLDQSPHQLARAKRKLPPERTALMLGDAEQLPFPDGSFDVVWSSGSIEYWPRPVATLAELRRVCRPGGSVLVVGPNAPRTRPMRWLADRLMLFYDERAADRMFRAAGYERFEHRLMGPSYNPEIAITTIADVS